MFHWKLSNELQGYLPSYQNAAGTLNNLSRNLQFLSRIEFFFFG